MIKVYCRDLVTFYHHDRNDLGTIDPASLIEIDLRVRLDRKTQRFIDEKGAEIVSNLVLMIPSLSILDPSTGITHRIDYSWMVRISGERDYPIRRIVKSQDFKIRFTEIWL